MTELVLNVLGTGSKMSGKSNHRGSFHRAKVRIVDQNVFIISLEINVT